MGSNYVNQDAFSAESVVEESSSATPIFFILFPGYSPSKEIEAYANKARKSHPCCALCLCLQALCLVQPPSAGTLVIRVLASCLL